MSDAIKIAERLRNRKIQKMNMNFYKGKNDFYIEAIFLETSCTNNTTKLKEGGMPSKNAIKMLNKIMKKLNVKSVNKSNGKPNLDIDLEFIKNKKTYCQTYFKK